MATALHTNEEIIEGYNKSIKFERWWVKKMTPLQAKVWDKPDLYAMFQESIDSANERIVHYRQCILEVATGKRQW